VIGRLPAAVRGAETATLSPDASLIAATGGGTLRILDGAGRLLHTEPRVVEAEFSPDSRRVVGAALRGNVSIWTARAKARLGSYGFGVRPEQVAPSPDERIAAVGDGMLLIRRTTGRHLSGVDKFPIAARGPTAFAWSPAGGRLVVGTGDGSIYVLDEQGREIARAHEHVDDITTVQFSPDGRRFVTSSADHDARVWDAETGRHLLLLHAHFALVSDARFSDDGRWIVTAGPGKAGLWNAETGRRLFFLRGHDGILRSAAFRPDTHEVVTVGEDDTVREYDCTLCGGVDELIDIAEERVAGISAR
jgi:WD40 repeat protein